MAALMARIWCSCTDRAHMLASIWGTTVGNAGRQQVLIVERLPCASTGASTSVVKLQLQAHCCAGSSFQQVARLTPGGAHSSSA